MDIVRALRCDDTFFAKPAKTYRALCARCRNDRDWGVRNETTYYYTTMKQKIVLIALAVMALAFLYLRFIALRPRLQEIRVGSVTVSVDVADTIGKQRQGLSGRSLMPEDQGMYFPMGAPARYGFWMKDMH